MGRRKWIKIWTDEWLRGSLRNDSPSIRGIWADILCLAGDSTFGDMGLIKISERVGFSDEAIADLLNIPIDEWNEAKKKLVKSKRIKILQNNIIEVVNWNKYQSEYARQRKFHFQETDIPKIIEFYKEKYKQYLSEEPPVVDWALAGKMLKKLLKRYSTEAINLIIEFLILNPSQDILISKTPKLLTSLLSPQMLDHLIQNYPQLFSNQMEGGD